MKRFLVITAATGFLMVSCKKDFTCTCKTTSNLPGFTTMTNKETLGRMKESDARNECNERDVSYTLPDGNGSTYNYITDCEIR